MEFLEHATTPTRVLSCHFHVTAVTREGQESRLSGTIYVPLETQAHRGTEEIDPAPPGLHPSVGRTQRLWPGCPRHDSFTRPLLQELRASQWNRHLSVSAGSQTPPWNPATDGDATAQESRARGTLRWARGGPREGAALCARGWGTQRESSSLCQESL